MHLFLFLYCRFKKVLYVCSVKQLNIHTMTTRNSIIAEIEAIDKEFLNLNLPCDQYGNHEQTPKFIELSDRHDELMEMLRSFPI